MAAAKIRKGDQVVVLSGKDKGKTGEVIRSMPKEAKVVVSGVNVHARHRKPTQLKVSQNTADLFIDGVDVLHADNLNLPFTVAYVASQQWDYDLAIHHIQAHLTHWDNIGFDAPPGYAPPVIHPYTDGGGLMANLHVLQDPAQLHDKTNASFSFYNKGELVAALLDLTIRSTTGHSLDEDVTTREKRDQDALEQAILAHDDLADLEQQLFDLLGYARGVDLGGRLRASHKRLIWK